jgi:predicted peptidase
MSDTAALPQLPVGLHEQGIEFDGALLRYTVSIPESPALAPLLVSLHYAGTVTPFYGRPLVEKLFAPALAELNPLVIAPDARDGDWTTPGNMRAVLWLTRSALASYPVDPKRALLAGFSMGARGTWHIAPRHPDLFTAAIAIAGRPSDAPDWPMPALIIHSHDDEVVPLGPTQQRVQEQQARGAPVELRIVTGITHYGTALYALPLRESLPWLKRVWKM